MGLISPMRCAQRCVKEFKGDEADMRKQKDKKYITRVERDIRRFYTAMLVIGVAVVAAFAVRFTLIRKTRDSAGSVPPKPSSEMDQQYADLQASYDRLSDEYAVVSSHWGQVTSELARVSVIYHQAANEVKALQEQVNGLNNELSAERMVRKENQKLIVRYEQQQNVLSQEADQLKQRVADLKQDNEELQVVVTQQPKTEDLTQQVNMLQNQNRILTGKLASALRQVDLLKTAAADAADAGSAPEVTAARLRLIEYDLAYAVSALKKVHGLLENELSDSQGMEYTRLAKYDRYVQESLRRLSENMKASY